MSPTQIAQPVKVTRKYDPSGRTTARGTLVPMHSNARGCGVRLATQPWRIIRFEWSEVSPDN